MTKKYRKPDTPEQKERRNRLKQERKKAREAQLPLPGLSPKVNTQP